MIKPIKTTTLNLLAQRPAYSVLANKKLQDLSLDIMRPWQAGLKDYLIESQRI